MYDNLLLSFRSPRQSTEQKFTVSFTQMDASRDTRPFRLVLSKCQIAQKSQNPY